MAKVDYNSLDYDTRLGRKYNICSKCNKKSAVTTKCPLREKSANPWVCVYCCWKCGYSRKIPQGGQCSIKANRRKEELEEQQSAKVAKRVKKQSDYDADYSFFDTDT